MQQFFLGRKVAERAMKLAIVLILTGIGLFTALTPPTSAQPAITEQEAHAIGVDAYI